MKSGETGEYFGRDLEAMSFAVNYHSWIIDEFRPYFGTRVAEVGAGTGNCTEIIISANKNIKALVAYEPSTNMYPLLVERLAGSARVRTVNGVFGDGCVESENAFDSVVYINVLEHIEDDEKELSYAHGALGCGGHALLFVPALSWLYSTLDSQIGHYRRYNKRDLVRLVQKSGFKIVKAEYFDLAGIIPWYVAFVLLKRQISGGNVAAYDKVAIPLMRQVEGIIRPPIGKNLLVVCRKA